MRPGPIQLALQGIAYALFAGVVGYFSTAPRYTHHDPSLALIKVNFSHSGARIRECRRYTAEELEQIAPNMRQELDCPRERVAVGFELLIDGERVFSDELVPGGLSRDGNSVIYQRFPIDPGTHVIQARLRDSRRVSGFDYEKTETVVLTPLQNFLIDFRAETGGFKFL